jgi:alanine-glyoxylate transaminase/serine-glyoxylate transaminase/serine-pyruvate transaminase
MTSSFNPPVRRLMGPGPSDVHPRVLAALARPTIGHLDPAFSAMMEELKEMLRYAFSTKNELTIPVSGPGSVGLETCFVNLVEPGDTVIVCQNGAFGGRMKENVERCGGTAVMVMDNWGKPVDLTKIEDALKANPGAKAVAFVHAETSTGVQSDAAAICKLADDLAGRHAGADRRMGRGRGLFRVAEMPVLHAGHLPGDILRPRRRRDPRP